MLVVDIRAGESPGQAGGPSAEPKRTKKLAKVNLVRNSRLSIMKVTDEQWDAMMEMSKRK